MKGNWLQRNEPWHSRSLRNRALAAVLFGAVMGLLTLLFEILGQPLGQSLIWAAGTCALSSLFLFLVEQLRPRRPKA
jgi:polyferredoxin